MNINRNTIGGLAVAGMLAVAAPAFAASQGGPDRASLDGHADVHAQVGNVDTPTAPTTMPTPPTTEAPSVSAPQAPDTPSVSAPERPDTSGVRSRAHTQVQRAKGAVPSGSAPSAPAPSTATPTPPPSGGGQSSGAMTVQANANAGLSVNANG